MKKIVITNWIILGLTVTMVICFTSCRKEGRNENPVPSSGKLQKVAMENEFISFMYQTDGSLKEALVKNEFATGGDEVKFIISYNGQRKISEVITNDSRKLIPLYDNGEMVRVEIRNLLNQLEGYTDYEYLNGRLKSATLAHFDGAVFPWLKFIFNYDAAGNVVKTNLFINDFINNQLVPAGYVEYEYDNKNNPLADMNEFLKIIWQVSSPNNIKKETHIDENNIIEEKLEYVYIYDSGNKPLSAVVKRTQPGSPVENLQLIYSYR